MMKLYGNSYLEYILTSMKEVIARYVIDIVYLMVVCMVAKLEYSSFMELRVILDASSTNQVPFQNQNQNRE